MAGHAIEPASPASRPVVTSAAVAEDWRLEIDFDDEQHGERLSEALLESTLERDVHQRLGERIVVSADRGRVFLYADTEGAARAAERVVSSLAAEHDWSTTLALTRWHPEAEEWQPADRPLPQTPEERVAEHARLLEQERRDTSDERLAEWEVRVAAPSLRAAFALAKRLDGEGVPHVRRWRYVFVGATDEDAANAWAERLRGEAPAGSEVSVEATFASVERNNPFAVLGRYSGNP
jgi:hypothetical protein